MQRKTSIWNFAERRPRSILIESSLPKSNGSGHFFVAPFGRSSRKSFDLICYQFMLPIYATNLRRKFMLSIHASNFCVQNLVASVGRDQLNAWLDQLCCGIASALPMVRGKGPWTKILPISIVRALNICRFTAANVQSHSLRGHTKMCYSNILSEQPDFLKPLCLDLRSH